MSYVTKKADPLHLHNNTMNFTQQNDTIVYMYSILGAVTRDTLPWYRVVMAGWHYWISYYFKIVLR